MLEAECAFMDSVDQLCTLVEEFLCYMTEAIDSREMANDIQASEPICQRSGPDFASQVWNWEIWQYIHLNEYFIQIHF
jgi:hypothetical protein